MELERVPPHHLEHDQARPRRPPPAADEALVQQRSDRVRVRPATCSSASTCSRRGTSSAPEDPLLLVPEQAVRPVDRGLERAMPPLGRPSRLQEVEVAAESLTRARRRRRASSVLPRARARAEVVELSAQRRNSATSANAGSSWRARATNNSTASLSFIPASEHVLARQREALAARDAEPRAGHRGDQCDRVGDRRQEVLGVVDHDQDPAAPEALDEYGRGLAHGADVQAPARSSEARATDPRVTPAAPSRRHRGTPSATPAAACSDSRVLPIPPGPVSVRRRTFSRPEQPMISPVHPRARRRRSRHRAGSCGGDCATAESATRRPGTGAPGLTGP